MIINRINLIIFLLLALGGFAAPAAASQQTEMGDNGIQIYQNNPRYWQYQGMPVLLLGGSDDDNLFQWTGVRLIDQLNLLKSLGGNYVRCTMSSRDEGNVWPFEQMNGKFNLNQWNNEYWQRFENFLKLTRERDIIVQVEIWATYDFYREIWQRHPFNPKNNINYTAEQTGLSERVDHRPGYSENVFFQSVPAAKNQETVLKYQRSFVDKMLSHSLKFGHVLYSMDNETATAPEWGKHWSEYVKAKAKQAGVVVQTTEMWYDHLDKDPPIPHATFDHPETYSFVEVSQNNHKRGQQHWDSLRLQLSRVADNVRPLTNVKIYGADTGPERWFRADVDGVERFWRNIFGGMASARFHRPFFGLGLGKKAQVNIHSLRMLTDEIDIFTCAAHNDLLAGREPNEAYCLANPGKEYAVYFPDGGEVELDINLLKRTGSIRWMEISTVKWGERQELKPARRVTLRPPEPGAWIALLVEGPALPHGNATSTQTIQAPYPPSPVVTAMRLDWTTHKRSAQGSDNFQLTWADDDHLYGAWGDGGGFGGTNKEGRVGLGVARVEGPWKDYRGYNVWGGKHAENTAQFNGKSWGMICLKGVLYMWVVPDCSEEEKIWHYTEARLAESTDHGAHWTKANWAFHETEKLTIPTICNFGKNYSGARDNYVYHYFIRPQDNMPPFNSKRVPESLIAHKPGRIYLARVEEDKIFDSRDNYQFFIGLDKNGSPKWGDISAKQPVFEDKNGTGWCMSVSYNPGFDRYILCTEHTESSKGNLGVFDAPEPWGPWTTVEYFDSWGKGHIELNTFFWSYPTKWLSEDGQEFTLGFTGAGLGLNNDSFNTIRGRFILKDVPGRLDARNP